MPACTACQLLQKLCQCQPCYRTHRYAEVQAGFSVHMLVLVRVWVQWLACQLDGLGCSTAWHCSPQFTPCYCCFAFQFPRLSYRHLLGMWHLDDAVLHTPAWGWCAWPASALWTSWSS